MSKLIFNNSKDTLTINANGNVGHGCIAPNAKLNVRPSERMWDYKDIEQFLNKDKAELAVDMVSDDPCTRRMAELIYKKLYEPTTLDGSPKVEIYE